jgi:hypothetical protein
MSRDALRALIGVATGLAQEYIEAEVLTPPALLSSGDEAAVWACDVKLSASAEIVRAVPIATASSETIYATIAAESGSSGSAVTVHRDPRTGRMEIVGFAKRKPGEYKWQDVNLDTAVGGAITDETLSSRYLTYAELDTYGDYGTIPYDAVGVFRGSTLIEVLP